MKEINVIDSSAKASIRCVEVLISRDFLRRDSDNLFWTLSVYSLENQPVRGNRDVNHAVLFHFMLYDWSRTIKDLLDAHQVPYSIVQFFDPETIYSDERRTVVDSPDSEAAFLSAIHGLSRHEDRSIASDSIPPVVPQ